ncbi:MAG: carbon-nitrogen hydrolase family protein [Pseudomonadota bacterium]
MKVAMAQIAARLLDRDATLLRVVAAIEEAAKGGASLVCFGEALVPGYPFWVERTDGARFDAADQKHWHARYQREAVQIEAGHLEPVCKVARSHAIAVYLGVMERPPERGGHSLYASLVFIGADGNIGSVHRKLMPTYEERLVWSTGDGHGLQVHALGPFTVGGLNCWENWMPLARSALYAQGENLHVAVWPGNVRNTENITRFIAQESRSYVISVCGLMRAKDLPDELRVAPFNLQLNETVANGGSCIAAPDGTWVRAPVAETQGVFIDTLDFEQVRQERHNFDPSGHYSRPDVTQLTVDRRRQRLASFTDD